MAHPRSSKYRPGQHWVNCPRCHQDKFSSEMKKDGQSKGLWVCTKCWDAKHPQERVKSIDDTQTAPQPVRLPQDVELDNDFDQSAEHFDTPSGTFTSNNNTL